MRLSKVDPSLDMQAEKSSASQKGPRRTSRVRYELRFEAVYLSLLVFPSCTSTRTACRIVLLHYLGGSLDEERKRSGDSPLNNSILGRYVPWGRDQHNPYPSRIMRGKLLPQLVLDKNNGPCYHDQNNVPRRLAHYRLVPPFSVHREPNSLELYQTPRSLTFSFETSSNILKESTQENNNRL